MNDFYPELIMAMGITAMLFSFVIAFVNIITFHMEKKYSRENFDQNDDDSWYQSSFFNIPK